MYNSPCNPHSLQLIESIKEQSPPLEQCIFSRAAQCSMLSPLPLPALSLFALPLYICCHACPCVCVYVCVCHYLSVRVCIWVCVCVRAIIHTQREKERKEWVTIASFSPVICDELMRYMSVCPAHTETDTHTDIYIHTRLTRPLQLRTYFSHLLYSILSIFLSICFVSPWENGQTERQTESFKKQWKFFPAKWKAYLVEVRMMSDLYSIKIW